MDATELMEAHKKAAWIALLESFQLNAATATTARALFMAGWDAAAIKSARREADVPIQYAMAHLSEAQVAYLASLPNAVV